MHKETVWVPQTNYSMNVNLSDLVCLFQQPFKTCGCNISVDNYFQLFPDFLFSLSLSPSPLMDKSSKLSEEGHKLCNNHKLPTKSYEMDGTLNSCSVTYLRACMEKDWCVLKQQTFSRKRYELPMPLLSKKSWNIHWRIELGVLICGS